MNYKYDLEFNDGFETLVGETLTSLEMQGDVLVFTCESGKVFEMGYIPDCCASCYLESGLEDAKDLVGQKLERAMVDSSYTTPEDYKHEWSEPESQTWTFYTLRTNKGTAQLRWFGSSNGYYSETPTFRRIQ